MKIAIVGGTAGLGYGLAIRLAAAGDEVVIGSRSAEKAIAAGSAIAAASGAAEVRGMENPESVVGADIIVVTVPFPGQAAIYAAIKAARPDGATVVDCTVPLASEFGGKATRMVGVWEGSAAQQAKSILGKEFHLASGFHTVMAGLLEDLTSPLDGDVLVCGDDEGKRAAAYLVSKIEGARVVDCGPLERARFLESLTALLIGLNVRHKIHPGAGIKITGLPD